MIRYLSDDFADTQKHFPGDSWSEAGNNLYGCLKQLYLLKKQNRNLKVLLSIGGWTYSSNFARSASTSQGRTIFASSAVALMANLGFDGLDIDWEYPADDNEANNMVYLVQEVRRTLDVYGNSLTTPYHFQLTVTCPAGPDNYKRLHLAELNTYIDFWNLMAFDYVGSWSSVAGNQANLFVSTDNSASTPFNTETTVQYYTSHGIPSRRIVLGMPIYGRSFEATDGLGKSFYGVGTGTWEAGAYDYKALPLIGAVEHYDNSTGSSYSYDPIKRELISYDNVAVAKQKAAWIQQMELGGAMWWESSADGTGEQSLIENVVEILGGEGGSSLESSSNTLNYPNSTFDNLRAGMPELNSGQSPFTSLIASTTLLFSSFTSDATFFTATSCTGDLSLEPSLDSSWSTTTLHSSQSDTVDISSVTVTVISTICPGKHKSNNILLYTDCYRYYRISIVVLSEGFVSSTDS